MLSLLDSLNNENIWNDFLVSKENSKNLPKKVIKKYQEFICNKKYTDIAETIIDGTYKFSIPRKVLIGKMGKKKKRAVYIYKESENYILKMLSYLLYKYDDVFSPNLYSFRKNNGIKKAIYMITKTRKINRMCSYKVDIKNYFNSIPVEMLLKDLKYDLKDEKLYNLIEKLLLNKKVKYEDKIILEEKGIMAGVPISAFEAISKRKTKLLVVASNISAKSQKELKFHAEKNKIPFLILEETGIMAGVPISTFLANYYLKDLDKYFYRNNILYARYADDIIVFGKSMIEVKEYQKIIKEFLDNKKLSINEEKEYFYEAGEKFEFLGFSFKDGTIDISSNSFKKIKGKIRRTARGLRRWMIRKNTTPEITLKAMNRKYNNKFFGKNENDLTWKYWFFPVINTDSTLKQIDKYMQEEQRYLVTGVHNKRNFDKVPYEFLKKCNYKSLVNEYYKSKK